MAVSHREPDRAPVGEWQFGNEIIDAVLQRETVFFTGLKKSQALWNGQRDAIVDEWKKGLVELVLKLEWDAVLVHTVIGPDTPIDVPRQIDERTWKYDSGKTLRYSEETDRLFVIEEGESEAVSTPPAGEPEDPTPTDSEMEVVRYVRKELGDTHFIFSAPLTGHPKLSFAKASGEEMEAWVRAFEDPDKFCEEFLNYVESVAAPGVRKSVVEGMDGVAFGQDYGCNTGPFISPEIFRRAVFPGLKALCDVVHENGMVMLLHACGNNQILMDMIVEAGVDVYQSIQEEMDIRGLKKRYGGQITLWGGVPAGDLIRATPEKVKETAKEYLDACKPGGGYIFGTSHSIMPGAKYINYKAMLAALKENGGYLPCCRRNFPDITDIPNNDKDATI